MPSVTVHYSNEEWLEITAEAAARKHKPGAFCKAAPLTLARARRVEIPQLVHVPADVRLKIVASLLGLGHDHDSGGDTSR